MLTPLLGKSSYELPKHNADHPPGQQRQHPDRVDDKGDLRLRASNEPPQAFQHVREHKRELVAFLRVKES
jgi:hypothetical protein